MSADFGRALEPLRADLAMTALADPALVRRQGDRRRQRLVLAAAAATLAVLGGTAGAVTYLHGPWNSAPRPGVTLTPSTTPAPPTAPSTTEPSPDPSPTDQPAPPDPQAATGVPDAAMLPDLRDPESYVRALEYMTFVSPPRPCAGGDHASDAERVRFRAGHNMMPGLGQSPEVVIEFVAQYRNPAAAAMSIQEIRDDIQRCPGVIGSGIDRGDQAWSVVGSGFAGDESELIRLRAIHQGYQATGGFCANVYVAVARSGDLLVAVTSLGWEGTGTDAAFTRQTAATALTAARAVL